MSMSPPLGIKASSQSIRMEVLGFLLTAPQPWPLVSIAGRSVSSSSTTRICSTSGPLRYWICSMGRGDAQFGEQRGGLVQTGLIMARSMSTRVTFALPRWSARIEADLRPPPSTGINSRTYGQYTLHTYGNLFYLTLKPPQPEKVANEPPNALGAYRGLLPGHVSCRDRIHRLWNLQ